MTDKEREYNKLVANNFKRIAYEHDKTQKQISDDLKIHKATISAWMNGTRGLKMSNIDTLCSYFGVSRNDFMEPYTGEKKRTESGSIRIPVLGNVAAGIPIEAITDIIDWEEISADMGRTGQFFGLKVKGDSMQPRIAEGDVLIVRCQPDAENGDIVVVQVNGNMATCKKLHKHSGGVTLVSLNPIYEPMSFTNEEIESMPVVVIGKVVENRAKF